jgi:ABC-type thiamin/hydroxymethylpyrimidine transport system permease subunit
LALADALPALIVQALVVLIASQLLYAFFPYRRRAYLPVLLLTALGVGLGQFWDFLGLPSLRFGNANLVPALVFVLALAPLAPRIPIRFR